MTNNNLSFDGPDEVAAYTFLAIRRALAFRVKTGHSLMRGQEIKAARRWGWTASRTAAGALSDMNDIATEMGLPAIS